MKKTLLLGMLVVSALLPVQASLYSIGNVNGSGTSLNQTIYDANPSGITSSLLVSGVARAPPRAIVLASASRVEREIHFRPRHTIRPESSASVWLRRRTARCTENQNPCPPYLFSEVQLGLGFGFRLLLCGRRFFLGNKFRRQQQIRNRVILPE